jgi:transposase
MVAHAQGRLERARNALDNRATQPEFLLVKRSYNGPMESVTRSDPAWKEAFRRHVAELRGEIHSLERELPRLEKILADWAPEQA